MGIKKLDTALTILVIVVLIILIVQKMEELDLTSDRLEELTAESVLLEHRITVQDQAIKDMETQQAEINKQLSEMKTIDMEWLYWIGENWHLVKKVGN